jgi:hypothetical protein
MRLPSPVDPSLIRGVEMQPAYCHGTARRLTERLDRSFADQGRRARWARSLIPRLTPHAATQIEVTESQPVFVSGPTKTN